LVWQGVAKLIATLTPYPMMKESGLRWLGKVPDHWLVLPNRALFAEIKDRNHPQEEMLSVTITKGVVKQKDLLADSSKKDSSNLDRSAYKLVQSSDIAYNKMRAWQGAIGASDYRGIISPAYVVMRLRGDANPRYFHHLYRTPQFAKEAERWSYGITSDMWSLRPEHFRLIYSLLPPRDEQDAIVRFVEHADRRIRRYIRVKQRLIELLAAQKQAIIHRAVTRGLDSDVKLKPSGVEWIDYIPENWEIRRVKQLCTAIIDCKNRTPEVVPGGSFTVVRTTNIRNGNYLSQGSYPTDRKNYEIWTFRGAPTKGDVFFTREAPAGEACLVPDMDNLCMGQRMMYFRPDPVLLDAHFLLHSIYGPLIRRYVAVVTNGSTVGHLRLGQVYSMPILWCPVEEQIRIVHSIQERLEPLRATSERAEREVAFIGEFRKRLIGDVVTGKLDVVGAATKLRDEFRESDTLEEATTLHETDGDNSETEIEVTPLEAAE
jgi:type I restriction enzyme, S subunit